MTTSKVPYDTRSRSKDDFEHVLQIMDIGLNTELERALQTERIDSIRHVLRMEDDFLTNLEYDKGDVKLPVPRYQITSLRLFIEYCKYRKRAGDPIEDYQSLTKRELDLFNLDAPVTVTAPIPGSSTYPPATSHPAMK